jgi:nitroreductase
MPYRTIIVCKTCGQPIHHMKNTIKKLWNFITIISIGVNDLLRYAQYSQCVFNKNQKIAIEAAITRRYHGLEKALSFSKRKKNFGEKTVLDLLRLLNIYKNNYGLTSGQPFESCIKALREYARLNAASNTNIAEKIRTLLKGVTTGQSEGGNGCTLTFTREYLQNCAKNNFEELCLNRYSIREYTDKPISIKEIEKAIRIAQKSPSACNRQSVRTYYSCDKKRINLLAKFKPGNKGFLNLNTLIILTTDFRTHDLPQERHQGFIEAGMFAMSLIYYFHYLGYGTCALHASFKPRTEKKIKREFGINADEALCLMISVGNMQNHISVPHSCRYPLDYICNNLDLRHRERQ